ncbi:MAG: carbonic anhydrase family protein [Gammaproteobacteria bacterium]|nr:carbonic anhydrase family protein [Gammaproteobacteria bacterium]
MEIKTLKSDILSSIVVTLVAIPLCLGVALACGVPLFSGILSGIIGGIVVGCISQSSLSVSGPAAGMIAIVIAAITQLGSFETFLLALAIAGLIQILSGLLRIGFIANYVPTNVIQGLLAAIGILIIVKQIPLAFGYYSETHAIHDFLKAGEETLNIPLILGVFHHLNITAIIITITSLSILLCWEKFLPTIAKIIPAAIVVVLSAILINALFRSFDPKIALNGSSHLVNIPVNATLSQFFLQFRHPDFSALKNINVYFYALMLAAIASLESLLNIEAIEKLDKKNRYTSRNRELIAQGLGNMASGFLGGLPITSVIVRSSVNMNAGAKTKLSTMLHGVLLLISVTFIEKYINFIPLAALAAILIHTGYKLASVKLFKAAHREGSRYFIPFLITVIAIVFTNLLLGILIGLCVSIAFILHQNSKSGFTTVNETYTSGHVLRLILPQQVTFLNKAAIIEKLNKLPNGAKVTIDARSTEYIDNDILGVIQEFKEFQTKNKNILLNLTGFQDHYNIKNEVKFINATTYDIQTALTPDTVLKILTEGNKRFINDTPIHKDYKQQMTATAQSQHPIAIVLSCIDSRVPVELIFDMTLGDVFVTRIAGNIANLDIVGSIEFACKIASAKLIVVLGHEECGAIKAACDNVKLGHLTQLIEKIKPAVELEKRKAEYLDVSSHNDEFVNHVICNNVEMTKAFLYEKSDVLRTLIDNEKIKMIGAVYNIHTGVVEFEN